MCKLNIVLLNPQIPQNTGNIARTASAINSNLHLIKPLGFEITDKKLKRAGLDYWNKLNINYYDNIEDFYLKANGDIYYFTTKAKNLYTDISYSNLNNIYIVFGREDAGIPEEILVKNKKNSLRIPMINNIRSLNLSNSVAIAAYEILRQLNFKQLKKYGNLTKFYWE